MSNVIPLEIYETENKLRDKRDSFEHDKHALIKELPALKEEIYKLEAQKAVAVSVDVSLSASSR